MPKHLTTNDAGEFVQAEQVGAASGVAPLGSDGKVPGTFLPEASTGSVASVNGHTGAVVLSATDVGAIPLSQKDSPSGVASLDSFGRLPVTNLPSVAVQSVNGYNGPSVTLAASDVGALSQTAGDGRYVLQSTQGQPSGVATLGSDGKVPSAQLPAASSAVSSVNGQTGAVNLTAANVGAVSTTAVGAVSGVASLGSDGKVPSAQLPATSSAVTSVNGQTGVVNLTAANVGAVATTAVGAPSGVASLGSDGKVPSAQLPATSSAVSSVNGQTGVVNLTAANVGALASTGGTVTGTVTATGSAASGVLLAGIVSGDAFDRWRLTADGAIAAGPGTATRDTTLARTAAAEWTMNGKLVLGADPTAALGATTKQYVDNNYLATAQKGVASGIASLDASSKVPTAQIPNLPASQINSGTFATAQIPDLSSLYLTASQKGAASGVATLDSSAKVPTAQIPDLSSTYIPVTQKGAASGVASLGTDSKVPVAQLRLFVYNVRDYGATGNGTTDDAPSIQAAINAASAFGGGWVVFPAGTYKCATLPLRYYGNIRYTMLPGAVIKRAAAGTLILNGDAAQTYGGYTGHGNILIEGGVLDMQGTVSGLTASAMCISIGHAQNITIRNVTVKDLPGYHGIELNSTKIALVESCKFLGYIDPGSRDFSEAIQIDLAKSSAEFGGFGPYDQTVCEDITIRDCYVGASGTAGTTAWPRGVGSHSATVGTTHRRIKVVGNTFEGLIEYAVVPYAYDDSEVVGNTIRNCGAGVRARTIISTDAADSTNTSGVQTNASQVMKNIVISNNVITGGGSYDDAILLYGETTGHIVGATVTGNVIETTGGVENGIRIYYADQYTVTGNEMSGIGGTGISQEQVTGGVVESNRVFNCTTSGISCDTGTNMKISDNSIHTVGVNGIHVLSGSDIQVLDNSIKGASRTTNLAGYGIRVSTSTDDIRITGNRVRLYGSGNEVGYGLGITSTCTNVMRFGNEFVGGTGAIDDQTATPKLSPYDSSESLLTELMKPTGVYETFSRLECISESQPTSGYLYLIPMYLPKGFVVSNITFASGNTAAATPTNQWFALFNSSRVAVARTANATTAAWAATTSKTLAIAQTTAGTATTFTTTYTGLYFLGFMITATTMPSLVGKGRVITQAVNATTPAFGAANSGQTTPPTVTSGAFTAAATSGSAVMAYGYVS